MANIQLQWQNASDNVAIKGYELSWRISGSIPYTILPFISTSLSDSSFLFTSATIGNNYEFILRTQDTSNNWSVDYVSTSVAYPTSEPTNPEFTNIFAPMIDEIWVEWNGGSDLYGIEGYELSHKISGGISYTVLPFISTSLTYGTAVISGLNSGSYYDLRIRTKNINNIYSPLYGTGSGSTPLYFKYNISNTSYPYSTGGGTNGFNMACSLLPTGSSSVYLKQDLLYAFPGDIIYNNTSFTTPKNGLNRVWKVIDLSAFPLISPYAVQISTTGSIIDFTDCFLI